MQDGPELDPVQATIEAPKPRRGSRVGQEQRMTHSKSTMAFRPQEEPVRESLKYSESMSTLKRLRDVDEENKNRPTSSVFKKGTSDFIKRKILQNLGQKSYETGAYQKQLERRFAADTPSEKRNRTFLPIEAFDPLLDIEVPEAVIEQYRDPATGVTIGLSKWNFPGGQAELRECYVDSYIKT